MSRLHLPVSSRDHVRGPSDAPVTLVEYGDFQCPHCRHALPIVEELLKQFGDRVRFVFRHFPLTEIHEHAQHAAEAAEAAGREGKFWPMHATLFEHQPALDVTHLVTYAKALGIGPAKFAKALAEGTYVEHVQADFLGGVRSGVNGTPTFFLNGIRYDGSWELEPLSEAIASAGTASRR